MNESTNQPISVVVPTYNSEGTIADALASVATQTVQPLEVIVVDDGSTDSTPDLLRDQFSNHRIILNDANQGPAAARNRGLAEATGEWIAFLDGDDMWLPHRLALGLEVAAQHPDAALICGLVETLRQRPMPAPLTTQQLNNLATELIPLKAFALRNPVATSTVLVKKRALESVGGFDESFRGPEDYDLWMRIAARTPVVRLHAPLAKYHEREGSLSMDDRTFLPEVLRVFEKAFGEKGVLQPFSDWRSAAESGQYWNASWMAFSRGDRLQAVRLWQQAYRCHRRSAHKEDHPWLRTLARYLFLSTRPGAPSPSGRGSG